eukprot:COSAG05_NODE_102_length_19076_cov_21.766612_6_plen_86_part_00
MAENALRQLNTFSGSCGTGACGYNRPCAHQYVGKSQSCMVQSRRSVRFGSVAKSGVRFSGAINGIEPRPPSCTAYRDILSDFKRA